MTNLDCIGKTRIYLVKLFHNTKVVLSSLKWPPAQITYLYTGLGTFVSETNRREVKFR